MVYECYLPPLLRKLTTSRDMCIDATPIAYLPRNSTSGILTTWQKRVHTWYIHVSDIPVRC